MERLESAHWVRPATTSYSPTRFLSLALDYHPRIDGTTNELSPRQWHLSEVRRYGDAWGSTSEVSGTDNKALWSHLRERGANAPRLYIIAEDGADALTALKFWREVDSNRFSLQPPGTEPTTPQKGKGKKPRPLPLIMSDNCDIVGWRWHNGSARLIHPKNHGLSQWEAIGKALKLSPSTDTDAVTQRHHLEENENLQTRCRLLLSVYMAYSDWWRVMQCGPWADTSAGLGYSWWRKTISTKRILIHDNDAAHQAECESVYGGRIQSFFHGLVESPAFEDDGKLTPPPSFSGTVLHSPLYHVDCRSMYVSLMRDKMFPEKIVSRFDACDIEYLLSQCQYWCVVARCRVKSVRGAVPFRSGKGMIYPGGEWDAWLTTPEIEACAAAGELLRCEGGWRYKRGKCMERYATEVLRMRRCANVLGDTIGEILAKSVGNALTGRLARRRARWVPDDTIPPWQRWGEWVRSPGPDTPAFKCRAISGRNFRFDADGRRIAGLTAIYSHLTAWGRCMASEILTVAGPKSCVAWDTDGGWFTEQGMLALTEAGLLGEEAPGKLRMVKAAQRGTWRTPKHHWIDGRYTLSGVKGGFVVGSDGMVRWDELLNRARQAIDPRNNGVETRAHSHRYDQFRLSAPVGSDGWSLPLSVRSDVITVGAAVGATLGI